MNGLWDNLVCECGGKEFTSIIELRYKVGGGTAVTPTGNYWCIGCQKKINSLSLIEVAKMKARQRQIEELQGA